MTSKKIQFKNRESWLHFIVEELRPKFADIDFPLPEKIRVSVGFTSKGKNKGVIGQCWDRSASKDDHYEVFLVPWINGEEGDFELEVSSVLAHELCHCIDMTHGKVFKTIATTIGLTGKMTATRPGPLFKEIIAPILKKAGAFPHGVLDISVDPKDGKPKTDAPPSQVNRYIQCLCNECGYTARTTRKWLMEVGAPYCPNHGETEPDKEALEKFKEAEDMRNAKKAQRFEERPYKEPGKSKSKKATPSEETPDTGPLVIDPLSPSIAERESWRAGGGDVFHRFDALTVEQGQQDSPL